MPLISSTFARPLAITVVSTLILSLTCYGQTADPIKSELTARAIITTGPTASSMDELKYFDTQLKQNLAVREHEEVEIGCLECLDLYDGVNLPNRQLTYVFLRKNEAQILSFGKAYKATNEKFTSDGQLLLSFDLLPVPQAICSQLPQPCFPRSACTGKPSAGCDRNLSTSTCDVCN